MLFLEHLHGQRDWRRNSHWLTSASSSRRGLRRDPGQLWRVRLRVGHPGGVRPGVPQLSGSPFARTR
jgi:hypothetical protein